MASRKNSDYSDKSFVDSGVGPLDLSKLPLSKLLNQKAPNVWKASLMTTNKDKSF